MLSRIFQYVANRNDFTNPWLNTQQSFDPVKADPAIAKIRTILNLDKSNLDTDYFVTSVVSILIANHSLSHVLDLELDIQPEIWKKIQTERFKVKTPGWLFSNSKSGSVYVARTVNQWPLELTGSITKLDDLTARVALGISQEDVRAVFFNSSILEIEWPSWLNLQGVFTTSSPTAWSGSDKKIEFFIPPVNYPIEAVLNVLKSDTAFLDVLEKRGYLAYFSGADINDSEKLAIIIYCLYLDTAEKINPPAAL